MRICLFLVPSFTLSTIITHVTKPRLIVVYANRSTTLVKSTNFTLPTPATTTTVATTTMIWTNPQRTTLPTTQPIILPTDSSSITYRPVYSSTNTSIYPGTSKPTASISTNSLLLNPDGNLTVNPEMTADPFLTIIFFTEFEDYSTELFDPFSISGDFEGTTDTSGSGEDLNTTLNTLEKSTTKVENSFVAPQPVANSKEPEEDKSQALFWSLMSLSAVGTIAGTVGVILSVKKLMKKKKKGKKRGKWKKKEKEKSNKSENTSMSSITSQYMLSPTKTQRTLMESSNISKLSTKQD